MDKRYEYSVLRQYLRLLDENSSGASDVLSAFETELTDRQRETARLYYFEQLSMHEIAKKLGVNVSTVSRTLRRARERLLRVLKYGRVSLLEIISD